MYWQMKLLVYILFFYSLTCLLPSEYRLKNLFLYAQCIPVLKSLKAFIIEIHLRIKIKSQFIGFKVVPT